MFRTFRAFLLVGGASTLLHYAILFVLVEAMHADPVVASTVGFALSGLVNYRLNHRLSFRSQRSHASALPRFATVALIGLQLNWGLVYVGVYWIGLHYVVAQIVATTLVLVWNFAANGLWSFATPSRSSHATAGRTRHA
jgi:putative flippase GtrA